MKVFEAVASALVSERVTSVFGLMGDGNISLWGAMGAQNKVAIYSARNEAGAVAMADGYYRATGQVGVATITCGPGLTQVGTSLMAALRNRSPVVVVIGEIPPGDKNGLQVMDQRRFAEASGARYVSVTKPDNVADEVAEAFYAARTERCPVVLSVPIDLGERTLEWEWEYHPSTNYLPSSRTASDEDLEQLMGKLVRAERPILIAGRGARLAGAKAAIVELAELTGALLATSLQGKGFFADQHYDIGIAGAYSSAAAEALFSDADLVVGIGAEVGYYTSEGGLLFPAAEVARIDITSTPPRLGVVPGLYVCGDAQKSVVRLNAMLRDRQVRRTGFRTPATDAVMAAEHEPQARASDGLDPRVLMAELSRCLPDDILITCGAGHFLGFAAMNLAISAEAEIEFSLQFGAVGQTVPVAFGIGVGHPGRKHLCIEGDGSLMMNLQELETVARHNLPLVVLVWNDAGFGAEVHKLRAKGFDPTLAQWRSADLVAIARAVGGDGVLLTEESAIGPAIAAGFAAGGLYLIDARVSPSAVSDAYQKIHFGRPNTAPLLRHQSR